ncbi:hypothetical protein [Azospirillum sp.]|uniref:hypothetical protein n=1 Tax=Azospirillum sp. TaxID=34012 RepID=UPI002D3C9BB9|nr:hypothetical protein [Azospirillum sp.]HYF86187.1 hypothetical protein [Azospirillum sp.]
MQDRIELPPNVVANKTGSHNEEAIRFRVKQQDFLAIVAAIVNNEWSGCLDYLVLSDCHSCHDVDTTIWFTLPSEIDQFFSLVRGVEFSSHGENTQTADELEYIGDEDDEEPSGSSVDAPPVIMHERTWFNVIDRGTIDTLKLGMSWGLDGKDVSRFAEAQLEHASWWATQWGGWTPEELADWLRREADRISPPENE